MFDLIIENALQMVIWPVMQQIRMNRTMKNKAKGQVI